MKKLTTLLAICMMPLILDAQINNFQLPLSINDTGNDPDSSAMLDVQSTDKGMLMPRMTTVQRDSIASPATGLIIYNLDDSGFQSFDGSNWVNISGPWNQNGDTIYYNAGPVGIGTDTPMAKLNLAGGNFLHTAADPVHAGAITDDGTTELGGGMSIYVSGKYAYVAAIDDDGVEILDISDPANPIHVGAITDNATTELDGAASIFVSGKYAYVGSVTDDGVEILDISNPANPIHVGAITDNTTTALDGAFGTYVSGKYAYVAANTDDGVEILDISNPANPTHVGAITDNATTELNGATSIYVSGKYAYVASLLDDGVEILDVSDPTNPTHVGAITDNGTTALDGAFSIYVSGKYAYVASVNDNGVEILDISDPANPTHVGAIFDDTTTALAGARNIYVSGKYAYVTGGDDHGVEILDISDPTNPTHVGSIYDNITTELNGAWGIYVSGKYAYVAARDDNGVEILDISGLDAPAASIGAIAANTLEVSENAQIGNDLNVRNGLIVGQGGVYSQGDISVNGNASINTTSPDRPLTIKGSGTNTEWIGLQDTTGANQWHLNYKDGGLNFVETGASDGRLYLKDGGNVGIGTTNPTKGKLEINGQAGSTALTYGYLNSSGNTGTGSGPSFSYSLYATNRIAASEFNAHSDARIKHIRGTSNTSQDLATLMQIKVTDYTLRDTIAQGSSPQKKVIAQQVAQVYPHAVSSNLTEVVPDIYQRASVQDGWIMLATDLQVGERVKLISEKSAKVYEVTAAEADRFQVSALNNEGSDPEAVFVYGREVDDFHTVDYEAISMLNVSATQELARQVGEQQRIIEAQQAEIEALKQQNQAEIEALQTRLNASEAQNKQQAQSFEARLETYESRLREMHQMLQSIHAGTENNGPVQQSSQTRK